MCAHRDPLGDGLCARRGILLICAIGSKCDNRLELDANKNVVAKNEYVGNTLLSRNIKNIKYNYLYNGHGDVVNLVNNKGGIENTYYYDSFGNIEESSEKVKNPFKYSKYEHDVETGLYYLKSRMYDWATARFMQMDTYKGQSNDPLSLNLYTYCVNEPMMYHDPDGHNPLLVLALIIGGGMIGVGGEYLGDRLDDGIINTDSRHYMAAFAAGSIEFPLRYAVGPFNANPYINLSIDIGSNLFYQYMAGEDISVKNAAINATIGFGINGLGRVSSKVYKVGINKISDALMPKINKLIPNFAPKIENVISGLNVKTNKILSKIDSFINKASNKVNSMISNVTPTSMKSSTLITDTIDNKLNLNKPLMMDLQLFSLKRGGTQAELPSTLNPKDVHFMQSSIKNQTGSHTVLENVEALRNGTLKASDLPNIKVWKDDAGKIWTLDHRRLGAFKQAGLDEVPIEWGKRQRFDTC